MICTPHLRATSRVIVSIIVIILISTPSSANNSENIEQYTLQNPKITYNPDYLLIEYFQKYSELRDLQEDLTDIAHLLHIGDSNYNNVRIRQYYEDGQILEIHGTPLTGKKYRQGDLSIEEFSLALEFNPLTRGSPITGEYCEPDKGESCSNCQECACYPNEKCSPSSTNANQRGCIVVYEPKNAHILGYEYVCDEGYTWSSDGTKCIPIERQDNNVMAPSNLEIIVILLFSLWCGFILRKDKM